MTESTERGKKAPGFMFYKNWLPAFQQITPEQCMEVIEAFVRYVETEETETLADPTANAIYAAFLSSVQSGLDKYYGKIERASYAANKRWHPEPTEESR